MGPVWALLLLLLLFPIAQGADTCDARQNNTQCYGALGGTMKIRLMDKGSTTYRCEWAKTGILFEWRNNTVTKNNLKDRSEFTNSTGIFHLRNLLKDDTGSYILKFIDKDGLTKKTLKHKLIIEAPVSSVQLKSECLSKGEVKATCTAEGGGSPEFSWTLDGQNFTDSQLRPKNDENDENTIILKQNTKGLLRCSVRNNVSQVHNELNISTCGYTFINCTLNGTQISEWVFEANNTLCIEQTTPAAPSTVGKTSALTSFTTQTTPSTSAPWYIQYWPILVGVLAAVSIAVMVTTALFCVLKKRSKNNGDEEHELTYADVRILRQPGRRAQPQPSEMEVEYGQVNFSNQRRPVLEAADNSCIYAKVRR